MARPWTAGLTKPTSREENDRMQLAIMHWCVAYIALTEQYLETDDFENMYRIYRGVIAAHESQDARH